jgi:carbohydrate kinase (thermoresistant glucokinase family)
MGVSGSGKSTVASAMAQALNLEMIDADTLHSAQSVAKMRASLPLQDEDRWPWLDRVAAWLADIEPALNPAQSDSRGESPQLRGRIVACSALKRAYRDKIRSRVAAVRFIFLDGSAALIRNRLERRVGHYMGAALLDSQFTALEYPQAEETDIVTIAIAPNVDQVVQSAKHALIELQKRLIRS